MTTRTGVRWTRRDYAPDGDPLWYKDAVFYELHVRSFYDSDGDGAGDFKGLTEKLDYLQDLGVTAVWLLPFYPSPRRDDGYDIADYTGVHHEYGSLRDFETFVKQAHRRGIRVITELVLNHTSDQHAWFQRAREASPKSRWRDFYVWTESPEKYRDARIIFKDFETSNWAWDPVAKAYYWHRFYTHQPDLNFDSAAVQRTMLQLVDMWLGMGVDGLRLDAVPYLYEREGTTCENLPETHGFIRKLRKHIDDRFAGRMLLAEANQWPEDAASYFGRSDECHMAFHFPVMPRLFMAVRTEDRFPIVEIMKQTPPIPETCQWAVFLRNHDELTLEMVTDEDRDYMYRVYAEDAQARINLGIRRRLAPLLGNHRRRIELMNALLFSLPGTPVIYYGDEIGMGDNIYQGDRNGVRTPMQWSADRNAGFSRANPQQLFLPVNIDPEYHYETVNVEAQQANPHSLLWWMKRLIALRKRYKAFGRGDLEFLHPENRKVLAFLRRYQDECILIVANLSRFVQGVELNLSHFKGRAPIEMFGRNALPPIGDQPYFLTLGPHSFFWLSLEAPGGEPISVSAPERQLPTLAVAKAWEAVFEGRPRRDLEAALPEYVRGCRWFGGKARTVQSMRLTEVVPLARRGAGFTAYLTMMRVDYIDGESETYVLPLAFAPQSQALEMLSEAPRTAIAQVEVEGGESGVLFDAVFDKRFGSLLLDAIDTRRPFRGAAGEVAGWPARRFRELRGPAADLPEPALSRADQTNTSIIYGDRLILKLFRRPEAGENPDLEIGRALTDQGSFTHVPPLAGALEYKRARRDRLGGQAMTVGILQAYVPNEGDAWTYTLDELAGYFERAFALAESERPPAPRGALDLVRRRPPEPARTLIGPYLESAHLLGRRTGELHAALASTRGRDFAPEPMTDHYRRAIYQSMRDMTTQTLQLLRKRLATLDVSARADAERLLGREEEIVRRFQALYKRPLQADRIRCHGDYHLGQALYTGKDFVIIDFEGEPARPLSERRLKRSPLRDVAGMLRSFDYAAAASLLQQEAAGLGASTAKGAADVKSGERSEPERWARFWTAWVGAFFLRGYLSAAGGASFLPAKRADLAVLLDAFLLEKAVYELAYELNNRPDWVRIPLLGIERILGAK